ncbi:hypothetical protein PGT21_019666 [Puccinia graminis f. sp. tritici]|uniref:PhoD-like phosphatase metallophosphatase domain-containing protein n=2 Tax=Puccinia graminis f. sp. tritici TaxID=56615 RepID=E3L5B3_PUCGT|nr:uncharacterized protein PGTG_17475 [Puccinia graminis f. sp. tritici CRL 75-36-700-3]EFP91738.2 hypothetical protein PGTG_17475 [Puccinia graminis f. sp. tritici CRL 75-36-700-3]KAA1101427.1 hypothetical protein PGT21_019666 [Puccinia graminis f. sp. tritici]
MNPVILISLLITIQSVFIKLISSTWSPLTNLLSIQIRSLSYLFLRWIPAHHLPIAIPSLFLIYALAWSQHHSQLKQAYSEEESDDPQEEEEQDQREDDILNEDHLPVISSTPQNTPPSSISKSKKNKKSKNNPQQQSPNDLTTTTTATTYTETDHLIPKPGSNIKRKKTTQKQKNPNQQHPNHPVKSFLKSTIGLTTTNTSANKFTLIINTILTLFCLDATFRTSVLDGQEDLSFSRVAAIGETWAKVHARIPPIVYPSSSSSSSEKQETDFTTGGAQLVYRPMKPIGNWFIGPQLISTNQSDWMTVGKIDNLIPGNAYEYRLNLLDAVLEPHPYFDSVGHFQTAPDSSKLSDPRADGGSFTFAYSSCIKPGFPYNPFRNQLHNDGAEQLAEQARKLKLDFVLFLGDFIYIDSPIYLGNSIRHYWRKYRQSLSTTGWRKLMQFTRTIHIYDDHEIYNDWAGKGNDTNEIFEPANKAYRDYLGEGNFDGPGKGENYYWFRYGDAGFFVWDCRRYRSSNEQVDDHSKTMLGAEQKQVFLSWLHAVNSTVTFKFVVSSTPFMSLWLGPDGGVDTWAGFLTERSELLDSMQYVPNLIVLSGDRHEFAAASIRDTVIEFSTSPLNQFWLPIRTLSQENGLGKTGEDKLMKYIPNGIHKFSTLNVDCRDPMKPVVNFKLFIDDELSWELKYLGKPVKEEPKQLGQLLPTWTQFLNLIKRPIQWFSSDSHTRAPSLTPSSSSDEPSEEASSDSENASEEEGPLNHAESSARPIDDEI